MKYFLGEIYITHRKTWFGWAEYHYKFTTYLIEANDWAEAKEKLDKQAVLRMEKEIKKFRYVAFVTSPL